MRHQEIGNHDAYEIVDPAKLEQIEANLERRGRPAPAASDMPRAAGLLMVASYAALMGAFAVTIHGARADFAMVIGAFYLTMVFAIPAMFIRIEPDQARRPDLREFLDRGIETATGRISGAGALVQMLIVPVLLVFAILAMGIIYLLV